MKGKTAYLVADLEGSTGAWTKAHTLLGTPEWQEARVELTRDINAVAGSLLEMGVKGVVVKDFHRTGYNLILPRLDPRIKVVSGYYTGPALGYGDLHGADFALFVGLHAAGGNEKGFLPHTLTSRLAEIRVNGARVCESELFATVLSDFNVPVVFFSGCPAACQEVSEKMSWVITSEIPKDPEIYRDEKKRGEFILEKRERLKQRVKEIVNPTEQPLFRMQPPFDCQVVFQDEAEARRNPWGFPRSGCTLRVEASHFLDLYESLLKIAYFPKLAYQFRSAVLPLTRLVWKIQSRKHL
jgi:D-amino peptidase